MMMGGDQMAMGWWGMMLFFFLVPLAVVVWAVVLLGEIRRDLRDIRDMLKDIAGKVGRE